MKGFLALAAALMALCLISCGNNEGKVGEISNLYSDATLRQIAELRASRRSVDLSKYCASQCPAYRKAAVLSLAALHDTMAVYHAASMVQDPDPEVRAAAIFALGEIGNPIAEDFLLQNDFSHHPDAIKAAQLVALAKCGGSKSLKYIEDLSVPHSSVVMVSAQCRAICFLASRGLHSVATSQKCIEYLCDTLIHESARSMAAEYFAICGADFSLYTDELAMAMKRSSLISSKANLLLALGRCHNQRALSTISDVLLDQDQDIRLTINAIQALKNFPYYDCKDKMLLMLNSPNENISASAAQFLLERGIRSDSSLYWSLAQNKIGWKPRTLLLAAALKFSSSKASISDGIRQGFGVTPNIHEKAALLSALKFDLDCMPFVESVAMYADSQMVRTEGVRTLVDMYESEGFPDYAKRIRREQGRNIAKEFALMLKNVIANGNAQMVAVAAAFLTRHPELNDYLSNSYFINQAIAKYSMSRDIETLMYLKAALKSVAGADAQVPAPASDTISWEYISRLKPFEEVVVNTSKGSFTIRADVNSAPVSVSKFLKLVDSRYYDATCFYCSNPMTVCNIGSMSAFDESMSIAVPLELSSSAIEEGTVALMQSPLGDSYSTQWNVFLYPSALVDENVTVLGKVVEGMDVVLRLNNCDAVESMRRK